MVPEILMIKICDFQFLSVVLVVEVGEVVVAVLVVLVVDPCFAAYRGQTI